MGNKLRFYVVDPSYIEYLKENEEKVRGFTRVPDVNYQEGRKQKFVVGPLFRAHGEIYYAPLSSYSQRKPDNFVIMQNGCGISSVRFNYAIPVPDKAIHMKQVKYETDEKYRALLGYELNYIRKHTEQVVEKSIKTYKKVYYRTDEFLVKNSCNFELLETLSKKY